MLTIEVRVPADRFTTEQRRELATRLTATGVLASTEEIRAATDPGVLDLYESLTDVLVSESDVWVAGGRHVTAADPGRYLVNFHVGAWTNEMAEHLIESVSRRITEFDSEHNSTEPHILVNLIGIGKGHYGLNGSVVTPDGFSELIEAAKTGDDREVPEGMFKDPVCGALVDIADAVTLERDGVTYGFCCPGCRGQFAKRLDKTAATS